MKQSVTNPPPARLELPRDLQARLAEYRSRVWRIKSLEAVLAAAVGGLASFVAVFALDRVIDTPGWLRAGLLLAGVLGFAIFVPWRLHRWVWRNRSFASVTRTLGLCDPRFGERLLSAVELASTDPAKHASQTLCRAAIDQVATDAGKFDFHGAVPLPRHRVWTVRAAFAAVIALTALVTPRAGTNAFWRWVAPFSDTPRYTFADVIDVPQRQVVARGEPFTFTLNLDSETAWKPSSATVQYSSQTQLVADATTGDDGRIQYAFEVPAQMDRGALALRVGDYRGTVDIVPLPRPELLALHAHLELPKYLGHPPRRRDARAGGVAALEGSRLGLEGRTSRPLRTATLDGSPTAATVRADAFETLTFEVERTLDLELDWTDVEGLAATTPFVVQVRALEDAAPSLRCEGLLPEQVVLEQEVLGFTVTAQDDFGVHRVGVEWSGVPHPVRNPEPLSGEYVLGAGEPEDGSLNLKGAFHARGLSIPPQPIQLKVWVEDRLPGRERVYSPTFRLYVLSAEEHMIWITEELKKWERQVLEVRDEEERLLEENEALHTLPSTELAQPERRREIETQAARERANAQRLAGLNSSGDELIQQAARNDQFNAATLERWAKTLQVLKQLSSQRMPSVAQLLERAAVSASDARPKPAGPSVSQGPIPSGQPGPPSEESPKDEEAPLPVPSIADREAAPNRDPNQSPDTPPAKGPPKKAGSGRLTLPTTTVGGSSPPAGDAPPSPPPPEENNEDLAQAVEEQRKLLDEFNAVMDDIGKVLADLYGSTFVKRLKHAARQERKLASALDESLEKTFGQPQPKVVEPHRGDFERLSAQQEETAVQVSHIKDDLGAFFQRTKEPKFSKVLDEMKETGITFGLKEMSAAVQENRSGETIAQSEYWVDQLDRWAEILVGPG